MIELTRNIPIPTTRPGRPPKYPYYQMVVGASFWVPRLHLNTTDWQKATGFTFRSQRTEENGTRGMRVFRIK